MVGDGDSERRAGRVGRFADRTRDSYVEERRSIDDWVAGRGALVLLGVAVAFAVFFILAMFKVSL